MEDTVLHEQPDGRPHIIGWGADLDPTNRPAVPKMKNPPEKDPGVHWSKPERQPQKIKVFRSIERPTLTSVFGTSAPPKWISGAVRTIAYKFGEAKIHRWLLLLLADRINVVEGIIADLAHGRIPNLISEMGLKAEWKYNRSEVKRLVIATAIGSGTFFILRSLSNARRAS